MHKKTGPVFEVGFLVYLVRACIGSWYFLYVCKVIICGKMLLTA